MAQNEDDKPLEQITDPLPTPGNPPEVVDEGRAKRLANLTRKGRGKGVTRTIKDLTVHETKKALSQIVAGVPQVLVAQAAGISENAVKKLREQYQELFSELGEVDNYRKVKADLFDAIEFRTLKSLNSEAKHEKASLNQVAYALQVIHNAGRLEKNQSTANLNVNGYLRFKTNGEPDAK